MEGFWGQHQTPSATVERSRAQIGRGGGGTLGGSGAPTTGEDIGQSFADASAFSSEAMGGSGVFTPSVGTFASHYPPTLTPRSVQPGTSLPFPGERKSGFPSGPPPVGSRIPTEELTRELSRLQIEMMPSFWKDPHPEAVQGLYSIAVELILGKKLSDIRVEEMSGGDIHSAMPSLNGMDVLSHEGALHVKAIGNLRFLRYCQFLCRCVLNVADFTKNDLFKPTPDRVQKFASAFVHYIRFQESVMGRFQARMEQLKKKGEEDAAAVDALTVTTKQHDFLRDERSAKTELIEQRRIRADQLMCTLRDSRTKFDVLQSRLETVKETLESVKKAAADSQFSLMHAQRKTQDLADKVVHSPEALQQVVKDTDEDIRRNTANVEQADRRRAELRAVLQAQEKAGKRLARFIRELQSHQEHLVRPHKQVRSDLKALEKAVKELKAELKDRETSVQQLELRVADCRRAREQRDDQWRAVLDRAAMELRGTKERAETKEREAQELRRQIDRLEAEERAVRANTHRAQAAFKDTTERQFTEVNVFLQNLVQTELARMSALVQEVESDDRSSGDEE